MARIPVLVIVGPTACGKSDLAVRLAKQRHGEVVSADSRQVYRGLDIGTGKITRREMRGVPHHLLDVASPRHTFTAHDFAKLGRAAIADIHSRGKLPIICGGTGFYVDALLGRVQLADVPRNDALRTRLGTKTAGELYAMLKRKDPKRAAQMDTPSERSNKVRLIRALEIASAHKGKPRVYAKGAYASIAEAYDVTWVYVDKPDDILRKRIHKRLLLRMKAGMVAEARRLHARGLSWKRMEALGLEYRFLARLLRGQLSKQEMLTQLEAEIWQYAKRQRTWWRHHIDN